MRPRSIAARWHSAHYAPSDSGRQACQWIFVYRPRKSRSISAHEERARCLSEKFVAVSGVVARNVSKNAQKGPERSRGWGEIFIEKTTPNSLWFHSNQTWLPNVRIDGPAIYLKDTCKSIWCVVIKAVATLMAQGWSAFDSCLLRELSRAFDNYVWPSNINYDICNGRRFSYWKMTVAIRRFFLFLTNDRIFVYVFYGV